MEFFINGKILGLSESEDGTKLLGKILICPLNESNLNKKGIKESDLQESELKSLVGQPLVGKVVKDENGEYDFTGHNLKKYYEYNPNTNTVEVKYTFDTVPIGYFTTSEIIDVEINGVTKRCIVANVEIWKRYEKVCGIIIKRFNSDKPLAVSWEINYINKYDEDGVTWLKDLVFIGVAILGFNVAGAYPDAHFMEVSEIEQDNKELVMSLTQDIINELCESSAKDENINDNIDNKTFQGGKRMSKTNNDIASLSDNDLYTKVRQAINAANPNDWYYISYLFPYEYRAIAYTWDSMSTDFVEFKYTVNSDDSVSITSQTNVKMQFVTVESVAEKDTQISELNTKLTEKDTELSTKLDEIIRLGEEIKSKDTVISEKDTTIAELTPFKEQIEASELAKKEAELAEKKKSLKTLATKGGYITNEEIETSEEIKGYIEALDEKSLKAVIAERVIKRLDEETSEKKSDVETSTVNNINAKTNINEDDVVVDHKSIMKSFLKG
jgi:hypothetical protein